MELTLTPETQRMIEEKLKQGPYRTVDELICSSLQALNELHRDLDEQTLDELDRAEDAIERGEVHEWDQVKKHIAQRLAAKRALT